MTKAASPQIAPKPYHHGNLVEALVAATIEIIEERGVENVSVREAAKRASVSPGAPFRHFRTKTALMTAVAEQAMTRLSAAVATAIAEVGEDDPMVAFEAVGIGYLRWALGNPTHFQIVSSRSLIDFDSSISLQKDNDDIRELMIDLLERAKADGRISPESKIGQIVFSSRAFVYGLARMAIDGHFPEWHVTQEPFEAVTQALHAFIAQMLNSHRPT
ncbi:TetR/AcrR family transcriptional regulator [Brucella anthropi]|uniref:TetR/AcrR family transcriptional regulator n=1 Tax=Brucella anthropi TaxID=529 RepID=UPI002157847B|nr:TetR/AcrR family transcriptional regulator [Brucella anthropi]MCR8493437.1 TetR/AcrR family transcriptional regulator [Brucella anthropi]